MQELEATLASKKQKGRDLKKIALRKDREINSLSETIEALNEQLVNQGQEHADAVKNLNDQSQEKEELLQSLRAEFEQFKQD